MSPVRSPAGLRQAHCSQDGVLGVMGAGVGRGGTRAGLVDQHVPGGVEEFGDVVGLAVVGGVEVLARSEIRTGVGGEEQRAAGGDSVQQAVQRRVAWPAAERK